MNVFKPQGYNSLSPYLIVSDAKRLSHLLQQVFGASELRKFERADGSVMHLELKIDDSVLMLSDGTEQFPPVTAILHVYVADVWSTYQEAIRLGFTDAGAPVKQAGDQDLRGSFVDFAGNYWSVSTQEPDQE